MNGYDFNQYHGGGVPDQGNNGLPLVIADANLPTQAVSPSPVTQGTSLNYSPYLVESGLHTPATTHRVRDAEYSRVAASGKPSEQKFNPTPQPKTPPLWKTVVNAVVGGKIKTGSSYAATGDYTTTSGSGAGINSAAGSVGGTTGSGGGMKTIQPVSPGGASTR